MDRKMMTRFREFAESPYHNKNKELIRFIQYISKIYPEFELKKINPGQIVRQISPKKDMDPRKLKHIYSYALQLSDAFLAAEQLRHEPLQEKLLTLKKIQLTSVSPRFDQIIADAKIINELNPWRDSYFHLQEYNLSHQAYLHPLKTEMYKATENLQEGMNSLDLFYLTEKLKNAAEMLNRAQFFNADYKLNMVEESALHIKTNEAYYQKIPSVYIYFLIFHTVKEPDTDIHFQKLRDYSYHQAKKFPPEEERDIYLYLYNFCSRKINKGHQDYLPEALRILRLLLDKNLLFENGLLPEYHYRNIVVLALRQGEYEWVEKFIHEYKELLPELSRENAFNFCLANYHYARKKYDSALQVLHSVEYTDVVYNLDAKSLLLRIYYELNEPDSFASHVNSFRQYLKRNRILSKAKYQRYQLLFIYTAMLFKIKQEKEYKPVEKIRHDLESLLQKIEKNPSIANLIWLKDKLEELSD